MTPALPRAATHHRQTFSPSSTTQTPPPPPLPPPVPPLAVGVGDADGQLAAVGCELGVALAAAEDGCTWAGAGEVAVAGPADWRLGRLAAGWTPVLRSGAGCGRLVADGAAVAAARVWLAAGGDAAAGG